MQQIFRTLIERPAILLAFALMFAGVAIWFRARRRFRKYRALMATRTGHSVIAD
ncbi:MAG: hypothetical protein P8X51_16275 [Maritimibacter sp.]